MAQSLIKGIEDVGKEDTIEFVRYWRESSGSSISVQRIERIDVRREKKESERKKYF